MIYEYEKTQLENGFYIVDVTINNETKRCVAEYIGDHYWCQTGVEYDIWQFGVTSTITINVIAKIELDTPTEIRMM